MYHQIISTLGILEKIVCFCFFASCMAKRHRGQAVGLMEILLKNLERHGDACLNFQGACPTTLHRGFLLISFAQKHIALKSYPCFTHNEALYIYFHVVDLLLLAVAQALILLSLIFQCFYPFTRKYTNIISLSHTHSLPHPLSLTHTIVLDTSATRSPTQTFLHFKQGPTSIPSR